MLTRLKSIHSKPKTILTHAEPQYINQDLSKPGWYQAMQLEYEALLANHTWTLTSLHLIEITLDVNEFSRSRRT